MAAEIAELLLSSGAYRDLPEPVIVTSGEFLTPFFVNAEKLCGDEDLDSFLSAHAEQDGEIIEHACALEAKGGALSAVVAEIARRAEGLLGGVRECAVSGGQRRDWLFSGPVARRLGLPHVSLYKQPPGAAAAEDRVVVRDPAGRVLPGRSLEGLRAVHVVDMITAASSCVGRDPSNGREVGWIPMLRSRGAVVQHLLAVVSRRQGGEEVLGRVGVSVASLVEVDGEFLARYSCAPEAAAAYTRDPGRWTRSYLTEHGVGLLGGYLSRDPKKLPRLLKFARAYRDHLETVGLWAELDRDARNRLGQGLGELLGGEG